MKPPGWGKKIGGDHAEKEFEGRLWDDPRNESFGKMASPPKECSIVVWPPRSRKNKETGADRSSGREKLRGEEEENFVWQTDERKVRRGRIITKADI